MRVFRRFLLTLSYVTSLPLKGLTATHDSSDDGKSSVSGNGSGNGSHKDEAGSSGTTSASEASSSSNDQAEESSLAGLAKYLPAAGLVIGLILLGLATLIVYRTHSPHIVAAAVLTIAWLCLTGGLHFDGLMDTADGIFSHRSRERMLEIMMDSRVGNFGVMTGVCVLLVKFAALTSLWAKPQLLFAIIILAPVWARWCELYAIGRFPYARKTGKGQIWHDSTRFPGDLLVGIIVPILVSVFTAMTIGLLPTLQVVAFGVLSGLVASHWLAGHIKGHTGDTYGAVVEISESGCLLLTALMLT